MSVSKTSVLDRLAAEEPCFGALFLTYAFDPAFFEEHVLRAVLRLSSDPVEQPTRYHDEAVGALQVTPVVVVTDAGERQGGQRLPYDLLDVSARVFHPKLAILIYERYARVHVGSGNLTRGGYSGNAELFLTLDLRYDDEAELQTLHDVVAAADRAASFVKATGQGTPAGTQRTLFFDELRRRMPPAPGRTNLPFACLDSAQDRCILEQALALIPARARITRIGLMAPFFERDDGAAAESLNSVFGRLRASAAKDTHLDVGVLWENPELQPRAHTTTITDGLDQMWGWLSETVKGEPAVVYLTPTKIGRTRLHYLDEHGDPQSWPRTAVSAALDDQKLWPLERPRVYAPPAALESARAAFGSMQLWLHPATQLVDGRPIHRPLHAKLLILAYETKGRAQTLVVVGSANASRRALLLTTAETGNVEICLAFKVDGALTLTDLTPELELVACPVGAASVHEREFPELGPNHGLAVIDAVHDPAARTLVVRWATGVVLPAWTLSYRGANLASGLGVPAAATTIHEFELHRSSAELTLQVGDAAFPIPILVTDLIALPLGPSEGLLSLHELLLLLGRRLGRERLEHLTQLRAASGPDCGDSLDDLFGADFGPTDVFRAWWSAAAELADPATSVAAFRLALDGSLGLRAVWARMLEAANAGDFPPDTIWFYGAELLRELDSIDLGDDGIGAKKRAYLDELCAKLRADLSHLIADSPSRPWMARVRSFYRVTP